MKKFLKVVLLLFFPMYITYAQTHLDSVTTYNKLNKWAVVKLTIASMEDIGIPQQNKIVAFNKLKSKYDTYSDDINLRSFRKEAHDWNSNSPIITIYRAYEMELVYTKTKLNFKDVLSKPPAVEHNRDEALTIINKTYDSILQLNIKHANDKARLDHTGAAFKGPDQPVVNKGMNLFNILLYFILAISIFLNIIFYSMFKSQKPKKKSGNHVKFDNPSEREKESLNDRIWQLERENASLNAANKNDIEKPLSESNKDEIITNEEKPMEEKPMEDEISPTIALDAKQVQNPQKTIYLPSPFEERKFAVEDVSENEKPLSLYVAKIDSKTNKGTISLIESANLSRALNSPDLFLETVCEYQNPYNALARGIKVINVGELYLHGEDWVVEKKIKIKFI